MLSHDTTQVERCGCSPPYESAIGEKVTDMPGGKAGNRSFALSLVLGLLIALTPKCPFCWAAYMSVFSSLGLGTVSYQPWFLPLMIILLVLNVGILFYQALKKKNFGPFGLSLLGMSLILVGKLSLNSDVLMWSGLILLLGASVWNSLHFSLTLRRKH